MIDHRDTSGSTMGDGATIRRTFGKPQSCRCNLGNISILLAKMKIPNTKYTHVKIAISQISLIPVHLTCSSPVLEAEELRL